MSGAYEPKSCGSPSEVLGKILVSLCSSLALVIALGGQAARADEYKLGPDDQLKVSVFDLRAGTGQVYQWPEFGSSLRVDASGKIAVPLIGEVTAADMTTSQLASVVASKLQAKVGLTEKPDASVQIVKYRPFYILGIVEKPGSYEYRPSLTILQAVSVAGGLDRPPANALLGYERDAMSNEGDLRLLSVERLALLVRQARLDAEIGGANSIIIPAEVKAHLNDKSVARLVDEEQKLFDEHTSNLRSRTDAIQETKTLLNQEVQSLREKDATLVRQIGISKQEFNQISGLVSKGLAVLPRQLEIEQSLAQFESSRLDLQLAVLRTQQDASQADRDILNLESESRKEALQQAAQVRDSLAEAEQKITTAEGLLMQAEVREPNFLASVRRGARDPNYSVTRLVGGVSHTFLAKEGDLVEPGDVVRVLPSAGPEGGGDGTSANSSAVN